MTTPPPPSGGRRGARFTVTALVLVAGVYHLALGLLMALAPRTFFEEIGPYPPFNDHYVRDTSTFYIALGAVLILAARRRTWQAPLLTFAVVEYGLHVVNHAIDVTDADPEWLGPVNLVALAAIGAGLWWLRGRAGDRSRPPTPPGGSAARR